MARSQPFGLFHAFDGCRGARIGGVDDIAHFLRVAAHDHDDALAASGNRRVGHPFDHRFAQNLVGALARSKNDGSCFHELPRIARTVQCRSARLEAVHAAARGALHQECDSNRAGCHLDDTLAGKYAGATRRAKRQTSQRMRRRGCGRGEGRRGEHGAAAVRSRGEVLRGGEALGMQPDPTGCGGAACSKGRSAGRAARPDGAL